MSGLPDSRTLWITPLSPVHLGTDEDYVPTNYVIEDDCLFEFDHRALEMLPAPDRRALERILDGRPQPRMLTRVQAFFHERRERLIPGAVNLVRVARGIAALYRARIGRAANVESGGREVYNLLEIERAAHNPADRRLYLPGSGLKGAIRTALLNRENHGRPLPPDLKRDRRANQKLQERLFQGSFDTDPLRLVQVSDCRWCGPETLNSAEVLFAVNRKKQPVPRNGREVRSRAEQGHLYQLLECAAPFRFRAFRGALSISEVSMVGRHPQLPEKRFGFRDIAAACNAFYRPILEGELAQLQARGYLDDAWRRTVTGLLADPVLKARLDGGNAFLLRVGRHSGAESVTLDGVRHIRIMKGKGQTPEWAAEAKTWWLAAREQDDRRHLIPFGWLLVELGDDPPALERIEAQTSTALAEQRQWLSRVREKQRLLAESLEQARRAAAEKARAEAERRRREEEQARRLAAMSEEQRMLEAVRSLLEHDRQAGRREAGGELNEKRLELLTAALDWSDPNLRRQAAELLEETARWLPWARKRKQEIREQLAALRGER